MHEALSSSARNVHIVQAKLEKETSESIAQVVTTSLLGQNPFCSLFFELQVGGPFRFLYQAIIRMASLSGEPDLAVGCWNSLFS